MTTISAIWACLTATAIAWWWSDFDLRIAYIGIAWTAGVGLVRATLAECGLVASGRKRTNR